MAEASYTGAQRAAILMMALGESAAASVLKHCSGKVVQSIGSCMTNLSGVSRDSVEDVLSKFTSDVDMHTSIGVGSEEYLRKVLGEALGSDKAAGVIDRIFGGRSSRGLEALKWMDAKELAELLRYEHPQVIATVLSYVDPEQGAGIINALPELMRGDIIMRVATLDGVHPTALDELDQVLEKHFNDNTSAKASSFGGAKAAANILNFVGAANESKIIEDVSKYDKLLAERVVDMMFVFDDLVEVDSRSMQELMREIPGDRLIIALKAADERLREHFFTNMSQRAAENLREELANKGPVKLSEVEAVQKEILVAARKMAEEGRLLLGNKGGGEEYV